MPNKIDPTETMVLIPIIVDVPLSVVEQVLNAQFGSRTVGSLTREQVMAAMRAYASPLASVPPEIPQHINRQHLLGLLENEAQLQTRDGDPEVVTVGGDPYPESYDELSPLDTGDADSVEDDG